ncbi:hypothetical protein ACIP98_35550 [Streptomyces sp. NPDC088354]|uniref:hypothetical protein n=1 Tax=Streptomyces sp. NPDC088354 TaxID=3365856 RepID=UPI00381BE396
MTESVFSFHVPRLCKIRSAHATEDLIPRATEAFRAGDDEVVGEAGRLEEGALTRPSVVMTAGAMVVLGEPGAGKTSVLTHLTDDLPRVADIWDSETHACLWITGGDLTESSYQVELGRHLEALPLEGDTAETTGTLWVVLDQADESTLLPYLPRRLKKSLGGRDTSRIRFLMACRTADYPTTTTAVLSEAFGSCRCVDLAPLSRQEAVALADSANVPGEELVAAAEALGAAVLASVPLTLELLVLTYRADGRLHGVPEDLFARGVERLAEDPDPHRLGKAVTTTATQRLTVAGRVAAWMLLSGHRAVWRGPAFAAGAFDLPGDKLAGGEERTTWGSYDVTPQALEETLATALFTRPDDNRIAFRHSSVAAYLAARYLTDRETTHQQLENLFLVGSPDGDTASIPAPLRETAAWLVAMNPTHTSWLAYADPESLAVHSALVRSDAVREMTVRRLLERAAQVELGDTRWQLSRWDLRHPLLEDQLADVLEAAPSGGAPDWETTARIRLAIQLAQDAGKAHPRLAAALLELVGNGAWHPTERLLAADAAFTCDAVRAVPIITEALASISDPAIATEADPDHALRGTLLALLWPNHLDVSTVLAALRPPSQHVYGAYAHFLKTMPLQCADEDLPELLAWMRDAVLQPDSHGDIFVFSSDRIETSLLDATIDRALSNQTARQHLGVLSEIVLGILQDDHEVRIPDSLELDEHGQESQEIQALRRLWGQALVSEAVRAQMNPREASWRIVHDWTHHLRWNGPSTPTPTIRHQLLDSTDFAWALDQTAQAAASGNNMLVAAFGELAARLFPGDDPEAFELAYNEQHPVWPYLATYYDPIALDSPLAKALRRNHRANVDSRPEVDAFLAAQSRLLTQARQGDNDSLWQFLWRLRVDPRTERVAELSGTMASWPGATALNDNLSDLPKLGLRYLAAEHDHADSWVQDNKIDHRSWAGYALLTELHGTGRLHELPPSAWRSWTAAILTEILGTSTSYTEPVRKDLLHLAARHASESLAQRTTQIAMAALSRGRQPVELNIVDPRWTDELRTAMEDIATRIAASLGMLQAVATSPELGRPTGNNAVGVPDTDEAHNAALRTWQSLLRSLLTAESSAAKRLIDTALSMPLSDQKATGVAAVTVCALLTADPEAHWDRVKAFATRDVTLSRCLAEACARNETEQIQGSLSEAKLADLYVWLSDLYPPEEDKPLRGVRSLSAEDEAREWRGSLLRELSRRATAESVHQLRQLAGRFPDRLDVAAARFTTTKQHAAAIWTQVRPEDVIRVLQDPARRLIRTSTDLLDVVQEVLDEIARELPSHCELLWDRTPGTRRRKKAAQAADDQGVPEVWRPKPEAAVCAYLAHELTLRLAGHRVAVNREVLIHPTDAYGTGDRTDILIDALPSSGNRPVSTENGPVKLVIEVKGAWNTGVSTAQEEQLAGRYLPEAGTDAGIYLVSWYPIDLWNATGDKRKTEAKKLNPDTLLADLQGQAARLSEAGSVHLRPVVITVPRPHRR